MFSCETRLVWINKVTVFLLQSIFVPHSSRQVWFFYVYFFNTLLKLFYFILLYLITSCIFCFRWTIEELLEKVPNLSAVIDLTNTSRYYNPQVCTVYLCLPLTFLLHVKQCFNVGSKCFVYFMLLLEIWGDNTWDILCLLSGEDFPFFI